jgi:queuine tRNA-ribosyltransferase
MALKFDYITKDPNSEARRGKIHTAHGIIETPIFMSVGTFGSVRTLDHTELEEIGVQIILGNTYHLYLRPGSNILQDMGGYHKLICWDKPILTDSGGFQIFSLPHQRVISEKGVTFKSYIDQSYKRLTPESDIEFQEIIGSDIMMVLDVCVPSTSSYDVCVEAMHRTHRWAKRCKQSKTKEENSLFGIVQGAIFENLRAESAETLVNLNFDGYAIGGLAVGETDEERDHFTKFTAKLLPKNKPRYLMGVGTPHDLVKSVLAGIDMFDCIIPTNHARQGIAYTFSGKVKMRRIIHAKDAKPIDDNCKCYVCKRFTRAYLHQLTKCEEPTGWKLISYHNTWFYEQLMFNIRKTIENGTFSVFAKHFLENTEE